jgi:AcrR family transcriptional regulator
MAVKPAEARPLITLLDQASGKVAPDDPRRLRTRTALMEAAENVFARHSYEAISVESITESAGVAKGSFYNHFPDKHHLATEVASLLINHVSSLIDRDAAIYSDPAVRCVRGTMLVLRFSLEHPESARALLHLSRDLFSVSDSLNSRVTRIIQDGIAQGTFIETGVEDGFMVVVGTAQMLVQQAVDGGWSADVRVIAQRCCTNMLRAFGVNLAKARRISKNAAEDLLKGI